MHGFPWAHVRYDLEKGERFDEMFVEYLEANNITYVDFLKKEGAQVAGVLGYRSEGGCRGVTRFSRSAVRRDRLRGGSVTHREDEIIEMLAILSRLQRGLLQAIPGAKSFVRPGLDEVGGSQL